MITHIRLPRPLDSNTLCTYNPILLIATIDPSMYFVSLTLIAHLQEESVIVIKDFYMHLRGKA